MNARSMAAQPTGGFRGFVQKPYGKVALVLLSFALTVVTFAYVTPLLAIPVFLVMGLALPILGGVKRPRFLAVAGIVVILAVAPVATVVFSNMILAPVPAASSGAIAPYGSGGSVLSGALVSPFTGDTSTNFTWTVTLNASYLPKELNGTNWTNDTLQLFISSCPGATDRNATYCNAGYSLEVINATLSRPNPTETITFHHVIGSEGIWSWQMGLRVQNNTSHAYTQILLIGDPNYNGIEGPVIGGFWVVYSALIVDILVTALLYLGLPFYFLLLLYMLLKGRERRRQEAADRAAKEIPPAGSPPPATGGAPLPDSSPGTNAPSGAASPAENSCPACRAVVYPNESKCWKCGATLSQAPAPASSQAKG